MEPLLTKAEVEARFQYIEALLRGMAERDEKNEKKMDRADQRMDRAEQRMDRADKRAERAEKRMALADQRMVRAEQRMEKFDVRLEATRKLVEAGMKILVGLGQRQKQTEAAVRELTKSQKAFLDSLKNGRNGHEK
jgi:chromosome segregation ATPase